MIHRFNALNLYVYLYPVDLGLPDAGSGDGCKESCSLCPRGLATVVKTCNMSDTGKHVILVWLTVWLDGQ